MVFDIMIGKIKNKMFGRLEKEIEEDEKNGKKSKVLYFLVKILPNILRSIFVFLGFFYIFNKMLTKYGIEKVILIFCIIFMLSMKGLQKTLDEINKSLKEV